MKGVVSMRLPSAPEKYSNSEIYTTHKMKHIDAFDRDYVIFSDKDRIKFIKTVEKVIRSSMEYKEYIKYLKDVIDMTKCSFFTNINSENAKKKISIEIHHEPFTLFDLVSIVYIRHKSMGRDPNPLLIAEEVMKLHYQDRVGLIPLSVTVHELVHNGKLFIPLQCVAGNYLEFLKEYMDDIDPELQSILKKKIEMSKEVVDTSILQKRFVYLEVEGFRLPQLISKAS
jgi:hypothetical protein